MKVTWRDYEENYEINEKLYFLFGGEQILSYLVVEYSVTILNFWLLLNWKLTPDPIPTGEKSEYMRLQVFGHWIQLSGSSEIPVVPQN